MLQLALKYYEPYILARRELRNRMVVGELTADRLRALVFLTTQNAEQADLAKARYLLDSTRPKT